METTPEVMPEYGNSSDYYVDGSDYYYALDVAGNSSDDFDGGGGGGGGNGSSCGGLAILDDDYIRVWENFTFFCEGVLMLPLGALGFLGNVFAVGVLGSSREKGRFPFHHLLIGLSICDLVFIACSVPVHAVNIFRAGWITRLMQTWVFGKIYQFVLYPFSTVGYTAGVNLTMVITLERFYAIQFPILYHNCLRKTTPIARALKLILPAVAIAFLLNWPKFVEMEVTFTDGSSRYGTSRLHRNPTFVFWYRGSFALHPLLTTTIAPILIFCVLNVFIYNGILKSRRGRRYTNNSPTEATRETSLQRTLIVICAVFLVTHVPRLLLAVESLVQLPNIMDCMRQDLDFVPPLRVSCLEAVSNLLILCNASCNFLIYCTTSTAFRSFFRRCRHKLRDRKRAPHVEVFNEHNLEEVASLAELSLAVPAKGGLAARERQTSNLEVMRQKRLLLPNGVVLPNMSHLEQRQFHSILPLVTTTSMEEGLRSSSPRARSLQDFSRPARAISAVAVSSPPSLRAKRPELQPALVEAVSMV